MKKSDLHKLARNPNFIPGIYNYCDRWCERCAFTDRCMQYAMELAQRKAGANASKKPDAFWKSLEASLTLTQDLLADLAREQEVKPAERELDRMPRRRQKKRDTTARHPLAKAAEDYSAMVDEWFKAGEVVLREKEEEILAHARLGVGNLNEEIASLTDVVEILRWYQYQIHVKLLRGLNAEADPGDPGDRPRDSDGSVKVALVAMDRSIAAWMRMRDFFPARTDSILAILVHLDRLRRGTEKEFPNARGFVRPGFDTGAAGK